MNCYNGKALLVDFDGALRTSFGFSPKRAALDRENDLPLTAVPANSLGVAALNASPTDAFQKYARAIELTQQLKPTYGTKVLLEEARVSGWRVGVVTSSDRHLVEAWLHKVDLASSIEAIVADKVRPGKPYPSSYLAALQQLESSPETSIAIEDSAPRYRAAIAAGLRTFLYTPIDREPGVDGIEYLESLPAACPILRSGYRPAAVRLATLRDARFLFSLRNDPTAVSNSRTRFPLSREQLEHCFRPDPSLQEKVTLLGEAIGISVAMIRFDRSDSAYVVSIVIDKSYRGKGWGRAILQAAIDAFFAMRGPVVLTAHVAEDNEASGRLFRGCGFVCRRQDGRFLELSRTTEESQEAPSDDGPPSQDS